MNDNTFASARGLLKRGAVADVRRLLAPIENEKATDARVSHLFGVCEFRESNFEVAESHFRTAVSLDGLFAESRYYIGLCLERRGRLEEARIEYMSVLAIKPDHAGATKKLGAEWSATQSAEAAAVGDTQGEAPVVSRPAASDAASRLEEVGLAKGIYTDQKSNFVYYTQLVFVFAFTLALVGGICGFVVGAATGGNGALSVIAGMLVGTVAGIANAGTVKRFK